MTTLLDADVAHVLVLLDRQDADRNRRALTYVDVLHACQDVHARAQAALAELESAGVLDWHSNGSVVRRRGVRP